jgi:hypothetical protein
MTRNRSCAARLPRSRRRNPGGADRPRDGAGGGGKGRLLGLGQLVAAAREVGTGDGLDEGGAVGLLASGFDLQRGGDVGRDLHLDACLAEILPTHDADRKIEHTIGQVSVDPSKYRVYDWRR